MPPSMRPSRWLLLWAVLSLHHATANNSPTTGSARVKSHWNLPTSSLQRARPEDHTNPLLLLLRGGSTAASSSAADTAAAALRSYRWQQQLYLQSRSMQLRQALLARGLDGLHHSPQALEAAKKHVAVDWECALATQASPKSCLYSFDAEAGTKVVAPRDTTQWITLSALNRLRRNDPTKVEPLWHSQYAILSTWLQPSSAFSLYHYLNPAGALLSFLLDTPLLLVGGLLTVMGAFFLITLPLWESLLTTLVTSNLLWAQWPQWGRFLHAALPFKLLLGQMAYKGVASLLGKVYGDVRSRLVEVECQLWETCIPLTILPEGSREQQRLAEEEDSDEMEDDDFEGMVEVEDSDEDDDLDIEADTEEDVEELDSDEDLEESDDEDIESDDDGDFDSEDDYDDEDSDNDDFDLNDLDFSEDEEE